MNKTNINKLPIIDNVADLVNLCIKHKYRNTMIKYKSWCSFLFEIDLQAAHDFLECAEFKALRKKAKAV